MKAVLLLAGTLGLLSPAWAQTTLLTEDFESGTLGSFTVVNGPQPPTWYAGSAPGNGPRWAGGNAAFISTNASSYGPLSGLNGVVHLYQDVTFPAQATDFMLRFDYRSQGVLDVRLVSTTYQPAAGVTPSAPATMLLGANLNSGGAYRSTALRVPAAVAGTTQRLVFSWASASAVPAALPAVLDNVLLTAGAPAALAGTYTLDRSQARSPRNFQSLTDVFVQLNSGGTSAPVTVNVAAGQRLTEALPQLQGANSHPVVFQKQGAGTNPQLQSGNIDLVGAHHLTFDGLDIVPGPEAVGPEAGYAISGAFDQGSHDIRIRNASITMRQSQAHTKGIYQRNLLQASSGPADSALVNRRIRYENLRIQQSCHGIWVAAGIGNVPDYDVEVARVTIGDGTSGNIGYPGASGGFEAYGMYFRQVNGLNVHDNLVQGVVSRMNYAVGIYAYELMGPRPAVFAGNRIRDIEFRHPADPGMFAAQTPMVLGMWLLQAPASRARAAGHPLWVYNNEIGELRQSLVPGATIPATRNGQTHGVIADLGGMAGSALLFAHNTVTVAAPAWPGFSSSALQAGTKNLAFGTAEVVNNLLLNTTPAISPLTATTVQSVVNVGIPATQSMPQLTRVRMNHNDLVLTTAGPQCRLGTYYAGAGTQEYAALSAWQTGTGFDLNSLNLDPQFGPGLPLRPTNAALDNAGTVLASVTTDLEGTTRGLFPDVGAYEFGSAVTATAAGRPATAVQAWPIPFADELNVATPGAALGAEELELLDGLGRVVRRQAVPRYTEAVQLTGLQLLPPGPYLLRLISPAGLRHTRQLLH